MADNGSQGAVLSCAVMFLLAPALLLAGMAIGVWIIGRHRRRLWKIVAGIGAAFLASGSVLLMLLVLFAGAMCGRYDFPPVSSPDESRAASVTEKDCGATDSFHSAIQLWQNHRATLLHPFGGRVDLTTVFTVGHDPRLLELEWNGPNTLIIRYPNDSQSPKEFRCQSQWEDVQITCIPFVPDYSKPVAKMPPVKRWRW
jgi:hypothetical protein